MTKEKEKKKTLFQRIESMHPYKMLFILSLIGSSLIFLFLLTSFLLGRSAKQPFSIDIPLIFLGSTAILAISSVTIQPIYKLFKEERKGELIRSIRITVVMGLLFAIFQIIGWKSLYNQGIFFTGNVAGSFLYVLTGLHALHFLAAHTYLGVLLFQTQRIAYDPIKWLVAETNKYWHLKFELITKAWHFLGILWLVLICCFWLFL